MHLKFCGKYHSTQFIQQIPAVLRFAVLHPNMADSQESGGPGASSDEAQLTPRAGSAGDPPPSSSQPLSSLRSDDVDDPYALDSNQGDVDELDDICDETRKA